jgi:hypothetical protein
MGGQSITMSAQSWSENFNTKSGNDFTLTGWRFNEEGTFYFSTENTFNMSSRHIRSQNINNSNFITTFTGYLYYQAGTPYNVSMEHSCVCWGVTNNNGLPRIEISWESFTTGQIVSTSTGHTTNQNTLNTLTANFTPSQSGWYRIRIRLSRLSNNGQAAVAIDNITSNIPINHIWNDTTVPMDQSISISVNKQVVEVGDQVQFTVTHTLNSFNWFTRVRGAVFQINLPPGFTINSHQISGWNYNTSLTTFNPSTSQLTVHTTNVNHQISLIIYTTAVNPQAGTFAGVYSSNFQPQNVNSSLISPTPITIIPASTQPVELIFSSATALSSGNKIEWATAMEVDNDYFAIERSSNGRDFQVIAKVDGAGTHSGRLDYEFLDTRPLSGTSFYRLVQYDFDGSFKAYDVMRVVRNQAVESQISLVGNPSNGNKIFIQMNLSDKIEVQVYNQQGQLVYNTTASSRNFDSGILVLEGLNLRPGTHVVRVASEDVRWSGRLMVR